jgi:hypothetical protein
VEAGFYCSIRNAECGTRRFCSHAFHNAQGKNVPFRRSEPCECFPEGRSLELEFVSISDAVGDIG